MAPGNARRPPGEGPSRGIGRGFRPDDFSVRRILKTLVARKLVRVWYDLDPSNQIG